MDSAMGVVKDIAQTLALLAAGAFFAYKAYTGYLRLSLGLRCDRQRMKDDARDHLIIQLHLKKGPNGSLALHDAKARVKYDSSTEELPFPGTTRSAWRSDNSVEKRSLIDWSKTSKTSPFLKLVPDEETDLSVVCCVPSDSACMVEVAVLGKKVSGFAFGQWKAACVSLPLRAT